MSSMILPVIVILSLFSGKIILEKKLLSIVVLLSSLTMVFFFLYIELGIQTSQLESALINETASRLTEYITKDWFTKVVVTLSLSRSVNGGTKQKSRKVTSCTLWHQTYRSGRINLISFASNCVILNVYSWNY